LANVQAADINWADIKWIQDTAPGVKVFVKGIGSVEDAIKAKEHGVDGIVLSNHGVRSFACLLLRPTFNRVVNWTMRHPVWPRWYE
jgi:isopentenyl diphosphate isomerase/L-lactate dehydrogenase-like FMN-dependent dehydrogenase